MGEEKRMGVLVRRWEPAVHGQALERSREHMLSQAALTTGRNLPRIREDCAELAATQKVTELTETKPGSKYPPNTTQGERGEAV